MFCRKCGSLNAENAQFCGKCGVPLAGVSNAPQPIQNSGQASQSQTIIINQQEKKSNGAGTAGFVLALIAVFFGWVPVLGWILWFLGLLLSAVGIFKTPRGLAITGLVISLIELILLLTVFAAIFAAFS